MSRELPRSVYVRRRLLLLAAGFLVAWIVVQLWPDGSDDRPTSTSTVTALPPASPTASAPATVKPTPAAPTTPAEGTTTTVTLPKGSKACASSEVAMVPSFPSGQFVRKQVLVDIAITTSGKNTCVFTPTNLDPIAVISDGGDTVWDSSICQKPVVSKPVQLVPGWATTVRVPWIPRESGDNCKGDEDWLDADTYTLRLGTLGGEPGRADFTLLEPPPPPTPTPTATVPGQPAASATPAKPPAATPTPAPSPKAG